MEELNRENHEFINKFNLEELGFFDATSFENIKIGFSAKKKLERDSNNVTLLEMYILNEEYNNEKLVKKPLKISLVYGKELENGGISLRQNPILFEPIDLAFNEYYYNFLDKEFYRKNRKIDANKIIQEVYEKHIKSTKFFKGFSIRSKIWFYRVFFSKFFEMLSKIFSFSIWLTSGNVYRYGFTEHLNMRLSIDEKPDPSAEDKKGELISLLGYNASYGCIMFYSTFHFIAYCCFYFLGFMPNFVIMIFNNVFLTLIYVMMTLIFVDKILQSLLKRLVKKTFELSYNFSYNVIKF